MNKCKGCDDCKRVYRLIGGRFKRHKKYYCVTYGKETVPKSGCEKWRRKNAECDLSAERIEKVKSDIEYIISKLKI